MIDKYLKKLLYYFLYSVSLIIEFILFLIGVFLIIICAVPSLVYVYIKNLYDVYSYLLLEFLKDK